MEWVASSLALYRNTVYPALLPLMRTPRLPAADWTDTPADINGLVRFAGRPNLVSARVPSHSVFTLPAQGNTPQKISPIPQAGFITSPSISAHLPCKIIGITHCLVSSVKLHSSKDFVPDFWPFHPSCVTWDECLVRPLGWADPG